MIKSAHTILGRIKDSDEWYIVNPLWESADVISNEQANEYINNTLPGDPEFAEKHYVVDEGEEESYFRKRYLDFLDERDDDEVQVFFVPWYSCNFSCSYCYQDEYSNASAKLTTGIIDAFFANVYKQFAGRKKYITIFGGEPLLNNRENQTLVEYFLRSATSGGLDCAIVTNGYCLASYIDTLKRHRIREVQVTLDGTAEVHDSRRKLKGGGSSFDAISNAIDQSLEAGLPINLRVVVDRENIGNLPELANHAVKRGWTANPLFKTQLGRNYELHHCQANSQKLFSRVEMYQELYMLIKENPRVLEFHKPAFSISKFLFEQGGFPSPLFDSCPGGKNEWAFDYLGNIYSCTATVGKAGEELGTYFPQAHLHVDKIEQWQERDVLSIEACRKCNLRLACGGGCASVAKNKSGNLCSPDCRPIAELLSLGFATYGETE